MHKEKEKNNRLSIFLLWLVAMYLLAGCALTPDQIQASASFTPDDWDCDTTPLSMSLDRNELQLMHSFERICPIVVRMATAPGIDQDTRALMLSLTENMYILSDRALDENCGYYTKGGVATSFNGCYFPHLEMTLLSTRGTNAEVISHELFHAISDAIRFDPLLIESMCLVQRGTVFDVVTKKSDQQSIYTSGWLVQELLADAAEILWSYWIYGNVETWQADIYPPPVRDWLYMEEGFGQITDPDSKTNYSSEFINEYLDVRKRYYDGIRTLAVDGDYLQFVSQYTSGDMEGMLATLGRAFDPDGLHYSQNEAEAGLLALLDFSKVAHQFYFETEGETNERDSTSPVEDYCPTP